MSRATASDRRHARPACHRGRPGRAGTPRTRAGPACGSRSTKRAAASNSATTASRSRSARAPAGPPASAARCHGPASREADQIAHSTVSAVTDSANACPARAPSAAGAAAVTPAEITWATRRAGAAVAPRRARRAARGRATPRRAARRSCARRRRPSSCARSARRSRRSPIASVPPSGESSSVCARSGVQRLGCPAATASATSNASSSGTTAAWSRTGTSASGTSTGTPASASPRRSSAERGPAAHDHRHVGPRHLAEARAGAAAGPRSPPSRAAPMRITCTWLAPAARCARRPGPWRRAGAPPPTAPIRSRRPRAVTARRCSPWPPGARPAPASIGLGACSAGEARRAGREPPSSRPGSAPRKDWVTESGSPASSRSGRPPTTTRTRSATAVVASCASSKATNRTWSRTLASRSGVRQPAPRSPRWRWPPGRTPRDCPGR